MARRSVDTAIILEATAQLVAAHGTRRVTMDDIARHAGVAKGVLYLRFDSKESLLEAMIAREVQLSTEHTASLVDADPRGGIFHRLYLHSITAVLARPALLMLYRGGEPELSQLAHSRGRTHAAPRIAVGAEFITRMQAAGLIRAELDAVVTATNLYLWSFGLATQGHHENLGELIRGMSDFVAHAVDAPGELVSTRSDEGKRCFREFIQDLTTGTPS